MEGREETTECGEGWFFFHMKKLIGGGSVIQSHRLHSRFVKSITHLGHYCSKKGKLDMKEN